MANSVDPDQMPHSVASDLGLHCLLRPVYPNTKARYGNILEWGFELLRLSRKHFIEIIIAMFCGHAYISLSAKIKKKKNL